MRRSLWVLVVAVACSHPAPRQDPHTEDHGSASVSAGPAGSAATSGSAWGSSDSSPSEGDEAHKKPIDGRVIENHADGAQLEFTIGLPADVREGELTEHWTGTFLREGKVIPGTDFKLVRVKPKLAVGRFSGQQLPSESVRLYEPYYPAGSRR
jgi:hypothetical protein